VSEPDEPDGHEDADDDPPFDVVQAVSDFVETVIVEVDADHDADRPDAADD
jgi:hypothetical protein